MKAELVVDVGAAHGEGPFWDAATGRLGWVDLMAGHLHFHDPAGPADTVIDTGKPLGAVVPRAAGGYALAVEDGFAVLDPGSDAPRFIAGVETGGGKLRMNDGKADPAGRFWAGTMAYALTPKAGSLYRLEADGTVAAMVHDVGISNGLDWSADASTMYYVDSLAYGLDAFDYDAASGAISNRRRIVELPDPGDSPAGLVVPDGLTLDAEGHIWVAVYGSHQVRRFSPSGELQAVVEVPVLCPTSCAFGGPDLATLYITTMHAIDGEPGAGALYACAPGVGGRPARPFSG